MRVSGEGHGERPATLGTDKVAFNGQWKGVVKKKTDAGQVELALPWHDMGMQAPADGTELRGNLCRNRQAGTRRKDLGVWSRTIWGFVERAHFVYWIFKPVFPI